MNTPWIKTVVPGLLLGFTVARLGFADYNELHRMLLFRDLRLLFAFATAVGLSIAFFAILRNRLKLGNVRFHPGIIPGAVLFGIGWALTGACPGVALVQIGQGTWPALISFSGILTGAWLQSKLGPTRKPSQPGC